MLIHEILIPIFCSFYEDYDYEENLKITYSTKHRLCYMLKIFHIVKKKLCLSGMEIIAMRLNITYYKDTVL